MSYTITLTDGAIYATIADGTINTSANLPSSFLYCGTFRSYLGMKYELIAGVEDI